MFSSQSLLMVVSGMLMTQLCIGFNTTSVTPSSLPTTSIKPSRAPTQAPSTKPTFEPTVLPSVFPSVIPSPISSLQPSAEPTEVPTVEPTTLSPTRFPSTSPTVYPTSYPTSHPSFDPSSLPSSQPSNLPSVLPSTRPSGYPSSEPTTEPSHSYSLRTFVCNDDLQCESYASGSCSFMSRNVALICVNETTPCYLNEQSIVVESANLTVVGDCPLVFAASVSILVAPLSSIQASSVNMTVFAQDGLISVSGHISTSGRGPLTGPGTTLAGQGGSYGGSGGRVSCNSSYFSNTYNQVGSVTVLPDLGVGPAEINPTFGSGGGVVGSGRGGGRIILESSGDVLVTLSGRLSADGSAPANRVIGLLGGGSGGSIVISARNFTLAGVLSVAGGNVRRGQGGAGGGGRININVPYKFTPFTNSDSQHFNVQGGVVLQNNSGLSSDDVSETGCVVGGVGTVFIEYTQIPHAIFSGLLMLFGNATTFAVTILDSYPSYTKSIVASQQVVLTGASQLALPYLTSCTRLNLDPTSGFCSVLSLTGVVVVKLDTDRTLNSTTAEQSVAAEETGHFSLAADELLLANTTITSQRILLSSINLTAGVVSLDRSSNIFFSSQLTVLSKFRAELWGRLVQTTLPDYSALAGFDSAGVTPDNYYLYSFLTVICLGNLTLSSVTATNMRLSGNFVSVTSGGNIVPASNTVAACHMANFTESFDCRNAQSQYLRAIKYNNTFTLVSNHTLLVGSGSLIEASAVLLCARTVTIGADSSINANGRGCLANSGLAPGGASVGVGGGGGGYRGAGGSGYGSSSNNANGATYGSNSGLFSGSGGGCLQCTDDVFSTVSKGGGVVSVVGRAYVTLNGNLSSNGAYGGLDNRNGGGAGGSVSVNTGSFQGEGVISAIGGDGSSTSGGLVVTGGGGGGGYVRVYNTQDVYNQHTFSGIISAFGGFAGYVNQSSGSAERRRLDMGYAAPGWAGEVLLPNCPPGYGNSISSGYGSICQICPAGTYNTGGNNQPCSKCDSTPSHSYFPTEGSTEPSCYYLCKTGYSTSNCYSPFENFLFNTLGVLGIACISAAFFVLLLAPLFYYRMKHKYGWFDSGKYKRNRKTPLDALYRVNLFDFGHGEFGSAFRGKQRKPSMDARRSALQRDSAVEKGVAVNPMVCQAAEGVSSLVLDDLSNDLSFSTNAAEQRQRYDASSGMKDMRLHHRLADHHMGSHACRINFLGSNHPSPTCGGPWILPPSRPVCLRPMLLRREYRAFAEDVNRSLAWSPFGIEAFCCSAARFVIPPMAASVMKMFQRRRAATLLTLLAKYDYACFRCPSQRLARRAFRVGISPDCTLAYLDVLFSEDKAHPKIKPLCPIGQTKLPVSFKLAGLGTYFSPYFVDTNDMILQAVPQTDVASSFIDEAWISFIVELNTILRSVQSDAIHLGILSLIRFLNDEKHTARLGGLVVEFCTFANLPESFPSDVVAEEEEEEAGRQETRITVHSDTASEASSRASGGHSHMRDTFVKSARMTRNLSWDMHGHSLSQNNWLAQLGDALHISPTPPPAKKAEKMDRKAGLRDSDSGSSAANSRKSETTSRSSGPSAAKEAPQSLCLWWLVTCAFGLIRCLLCPFAIVYRFFHQESFRPEDPHGYDLSFDEMCNAVQEGKLKLGILVTHAKVSSNSYILQDEDYQSEDDEAYLGGDVSSSHASSFSAERDDFTVAPRPSDVSARPDSLRTSFVETSPNKSQLNNRALELSKYYEIMRTADENMVNSNCINSGPNSPARVSACIQEDAHTVSAERSGGEEAEQTGFRHSDESGDEGSAEGDIELRSSKYSSRNASTAHSAAENFRDAEDELDDGGYTEFSVQHANRPSDGVYESREGSYFSSHQPRESDVSGDDSFLEHKHNSLNQSVLAAALQRIAVVGSPTGGSRSVRAESSGVVNISRRERSMRRQTESNSTGSLLRRAKLPRSNRDTASLPLAPSALQSPVNAWKLSLADNEPVPDRSFNQNRLKILHSFSQASVHPIGEALSVEQLSSSVTDPGDRSSVDRNYSVADHAQGALSLSGGVSPGRLSSLQDRTADMSHLPPLATSKKGGSVAAVQKEDVRDSTGGGGNWKLAQQPAKQLQKGFRYAYMNKLFLFYLSRFMFGSNIYPYGPNYVRKILELLFFALSIVDILVCSLILLELFCLSDNATQCTDHTYFALALCIWPGAFIIAPVTGLVAMVLGPSGPLSRIYATWSRLAAINNSIIILIFSKYYSYFRNLNNSVYLVFLLTASRLFQCLFVDLYIAHVEKLRYTRGWDGLHTSLFKTDDSKQEIVV